jgi:hypothetical protein
MFAMFAVKKNLYFDVSTNMKQLCLFLQCRELKTALWLSLCPVAMEDCQTSWNFFFSRLELKGYCLVLCRYELLLFMKKLHPMKSLHQDRSKPS